MDKSLDPDVILPTSLDQTGRDSVAVPPTRPGVLNERIKSLIGVLTTSMFESLAEKAPDLIKEQFSNIVAFIDTPLGPMGLEVNAPWEERFEHDLEFHDTLYADSLQQSFADVLFPSDDDDDDNFMSESVCSILWDRDSTGKTKPFHLPESITKRIDPQVLAEWNRLAARDACLKGVPKRRFFIEGILYHSPSENCSPSLANKARDLLYARLLSQFPMLPDEYMAHEPK